MRYVKSVFTIKKISLLLRDLQTSRANNSKIFWIQNVKFSGYCFLYKLKHIGRFSNVH